jgi:predicted nuclease of predicted toxin-antitoxin system
VGLRDLGIDVVTAADAGLLGAEDIDVLAHALSTSRVIVTNDADFLRLNAAGHPHAAIVYFEQDSLSIGELIDVLELVHGAMSPEEMNGHVEYIWKGRRTSHPLMPPAVRPATIWRSAKR